MALIVTVVVLLLTLLIGKVIHEWIFGKKKMRDIPGPKGWPLVGNSFQMDAEKPHETFMDWCKTYGNIFKIKIFQDDAVVLNDLDSIKEMLSSETCSARPKPFRVCELLLKDWKDIDYSDYSPNWNERKKALTRSLNAYGAGQAKLESITMESIDKVFEVISKETNQYTKSIDMRPVFHQCTAEIITTLMYGRKLKEEELSELLELERGVMKLASPAGLIAILDLLPWMRHLPIKDIQEPIEGGAKMRKWVADKHREMMGVYANEEERGIYGSLMQHVNKATNKVIAPEELMGMTVNTLLGGFVTSTASLYSLILVFLNNPDIQEKIYEEIEQVIGERRPQMSDRQNMPYVRAVMEENFRFTTILPLNVPHQNTQDTTIQGKFIPKGTMILPNMWKLHHDEKYFEDPWKFKPERYLSSDGKILPSDHIVWKHTLSFGAGRRICPGEGLGRNRVFLLLTSLMQKLKFLPVDEKNIPSCDPREFDSGIVVIPHKYHVKVSMR